ncbi:MAG TPA: alpha/beta fold hydrolase [Terracidiphilus sp.]|jgi:predicted alpha/beta-hydrolase family hydrolase|nr:alpha/beta fold hydrolase [Terracidiphilus sp.]
MPTFEAFCDLSDQAAPVRGYLHSAAKTGGNCLILAHGAGANCQAPLLIALADAFASQSWMVLRCDLPFRQLRPHGPPHRGSAEHDQAGLRAAVAAMRRLGPSQVALGGHSYGGRQASMLAAAEPELVESLLLLSYPLHPPKKPAELRTKHFPSLQTPALFVHGTRDGFATIAEMQSALSLIPARTHLLPIAGAGHELLTKSNREALIEEITSKFTTGFATFSHDLPDAAAR